MYPEYLVEPMRAELTNVGFEELKSAEEVDSAIKSEGTVFVVVNSVCGCAAANARPAAKLAASNAKHPNKLVINGLFSALCYGRDGSMSSYRHMVNQFTPPALATR